MYATGHRWAILAALALAAFAGGLLQTVEGQQARRQPTLEERLIYGLEARRPSELDFIDAVVDTVHRGELPRTLVDRTFFWARQRTPDRSYRKRHRPIIYFQPALRIQAQRLRIDIRENRPPGSSG